MSGAEIVEEIEKETSGKWKPSPGSIYPLLAKLRDKGYTNESIHRESGMKRYNLTEEGKSFFEEQVKIGQSFLEKLECLAPMFIGGFKIGNDKKNLIIARETVKSVVKTFMDIRSMRNNLTKQNVNDIVKILNKCDQQLKEITQRIKAKGSK